ncbi:MAG: TIGR03960 family B12-binding radical SAM protein [Candidatus Schekmanbacteria bacterium]|nr:MAG: TIGR03960 family B12-binding radical SAM protein [Candidatus Schekmanbacteria bacterium]
MNARMLKNLHRVLKPSRYIGGEIGSIVKPHEKVHLRFALVFPEVYELGISNLGLRILYQILNNMPGVQAERVYAPWPDMENLMRKEKIPPYGIECGTPLYDFDIIGFSLQYELLYTNLVNILDIAGLPFYAKDRDERFPLIIAGGPCSFNPEPVADFFDAILIGDGEKAVVEIVNCYSVWKNGKNPKKDELLHALSEIEGVYIPSFFKVDYFDSGRIKSINCLEGKKVIKRSIVHSLDYEAFHRKPIIPYCEAVHDRINIEIMRGCSAGCRFCQAGIIYRPVRERGRDEVIEKAIEEIQQSGYRDLALSSLNVAGHSEIEEIVSSLMERVKFKKVSISLPSLRADILKSGIIAENIAKVRKTGFTIAPEAGTQRLRNIINKGINEDEIIDSVLTSFSKGWQSLKLYFMVGLPFETDEDVQGIGELVWKIVDRIKSAGKRFKRLSVSISPFVPKAHTPFQWCRMCKVEEIERKVGIILDMVRSRKIDIEWHTPWTSILEGAFARGDRRLSRIIVSAFKKGAKFDGWREYFKLQIWKESFKEEGIDLEEYATRRMGFDEILPWDHIDCGIKKSFLLEEYKKARDEKVTADCSIEGCHNCGLESECASVRKYAENRKTQEREKKSLIIDEREFVPEEEERHFYRIKYCRKGLMKYLSHTEFRNLFERAIARANIPVAFTRGFHPSPCISYGMPLPVGVEGEGEYLDIELTKRADCKELKKLLNSELPHNIKAIDVIRRKNKKPSLQSSIRGFVYEIIFLDEVFKEDENLENLISERIDLFNKADEFIVEKKRKDNATTIDLKKYVSIEKNSASDYKVAIKVSEGKAPSIFVVLKEIFNIDSKREELPHSSMPEIIRKEIIIE